MPLFRRRFGLLSIVLTIALLIGSAMAFVGGGTAMAQIPRAGEPMILVVDPVPVTVEGRPDTAISVEVARTPQEAAAGLMYRKHMPDDRGMLFIFDRDEQRSFWMRNTLMPLDIIYIGADGVVGSIAHGRPLDETPLPSEGPAKYVLELKKGQASANGIEVGSELNHPLIGN